MIKTLREMHLDALNINLYYKMCDRINCNKPIIYNGRFGTHCEEHATLCSTCCIRKANRDVMKK